MAVYASDTFDNATAGSSLLGRQTDGIGGVWAASAGNQNDGDPLIGADHFAYVAGTGKGHYGLPIGGGLNVPNTWAIDFILRVPAGAVGRAGAGFGQSGQYGFCAGYDASNGEWVTEISNFSEPSKTVAAGTPLAPGDYSLTIVGQVTGGVASVGLYRGSTLLISDSYNNTSLVAPDPGLYWFNSGVTATSSTSLRLGAFSAHDPSSAPSGLSLATTGFNAAVTGSSPASRAATLGSAAWPGNISGSGAAGSATPILLAFSPVGAVNSGDSPVTLSDGGAGGTFGALATIPGGSSSAVAVYTPAASAGGSTATITATAGGLTATLALPVRTNLLCVFCNSIGAAYGLNPTSQGYSGQLTAMLADFAVYNWSVGGKTTASLTADAPAQAGAATGLVGSGQAWAIAWEATNSIVSGRTSSQAYLDLQSLYSLLKGYGFRVATTSLLARGDITESVRSAYNALLTGGSGTAWDDFAPVHHDTRIGSADYPSASAWCQDGIHPTFPGHAILATYFAELIEPGATGSAGSSGSGSAPTAQQIADAVWADTNRSLTDKTGYILAANGLDAVMVEPGIDAREAIQAILAAMAGNLLGAGTGTVVIQGAGGTTTRITATTDNLGNRTVTLSLGG